MLSAAEERVWISTAKSHNTADGATVLQVLEYVETMRPRQFKFGKFDIGYCGAGDGKAESMTIDFRIGAKRLPNDAASLLLEIKCTHGGKLYADDGSKSPEDGEQIAIRQGDKDLSRSTSEALMETTAPATISTGPLS